jgi:guanylate kinase
MPVKVSPPIVLLTGPSGAGKSSVADTLLKTRPIKLKKFVTCTTRSKRPGERHGREYWFLTRKAFEKGIAKKQFFEWANVYGHYYGSSRLEMARLLKGRLPILTIIDVQGMKTYKKLYPNTIVIFLDAPKRDLEHRLEARHPDPKDLKRRIAMITREEKLKRLADVVITNRNGKLQQTVRAVTRTIKNATRRAKNGNRIEP